MSVALALFAALAAAQPAHAPEHRAIVEYRIKPGDTLFELGARYFIRPEDYRIVQRMNRVSDPRRLPIGRILRIPRRILRSEPVDGNVVAFRGNVVIAEGGAQRPAAMRAQVREGMAVETGAKSFVTVELPDASRFSLPSNSRVGIAHLRRTLLTGEVERRFRVEKGRSDWDVTPGKSDPFSVETPVATTAVRGTGFRVTYSPDSDAMTVGVLEGRVAVTGPDAVTETALAAGTGAALRPNAQIVAGALLPAPALERPGAAQKGEQLAFAARAVSGASGYGFEIASDAGFIDRIAETKADTPEARFDGLPGGTYFVKATAFDANGVEGMANIYGFERQLNTLDLDTPQADKAGGRKDYLFRWRGSGGGTVEYRFVLSRDEAGQDRLVDEAGLTRTNISISDLPSGVWYWRVWSIRYENGRHSETVSSPQKLQIGDPQ
ncbi:FecR domain-containing protein [Sphingomonas cavernae]|uniref:LysM peptidoglycan-binding domain-containing protein n=1 Tax=Sphingomonas cavernae TaxID=2320861 RepID=A0A418WQE4_9SPHN|nr:FecR domain-containing protein [Sphingomonas cavernae]RJF93463.1 LysM peptidoglycan-binding domain-containing protein [Sphingomonas cavernae]